MKKQLLLLALFCAGFGGLQAQVQPSPYIPTGYDLVFDEEFDNPATKVANWKMDDRDGRGVDWTNDSVAVIKNGVLKLKHVPLAVPYGTRTYTAPTGSTIKQFKYGYFECRYKYSAAKGINNSFWLLNSGSPFDKDYIEIDVNEGQLDAGPIRSQETYTRLGAQPTWDHYRPLVLDHTHGQCNSPAYYWVDQDFSAEFHTYGFEWTPDSLLFYLDGKRILSRDNRRVISNETPYRLLNYPMSVYLSILGTPVAPLVNSGQDYLSSGMEVDYVRVYQKPGSTEGLPPSSGSNLLKNGGFGNYDLNDYLSSKYSWNAVMGSIDSSFYSISFVNARSTPIYMPSQNINVLQAGNYELKFRARVIDPTGSNTASLAMKISNNNNISTSSLTALSSISGGGGVSGTEVSVKSSQTPAFTSFLYRFTATAPSPTATYTRVMFYLNNPSGAATFQLDDVEIKPYIPSTGDAIIKDGSFNFPFKNNYAPSDIDTCWSAYSNYGTGKFISSKVTETNGNIFGRITTTVAGEDYHFALAQYTPVKVAPGKYKISLRARALVTDSFLLKISTKTSLSTNLPVNLTEATTGVSLTASKLFFGVNDVWKEYSGVFELNHTIADYLRINFIFHKIGTYDIDDVKIEPYSPTGISQPFSDLSVYGVKGKIVARGIDVNSVLEIYSTSGILLRKVALSKQKEVTVRKGVYLVKLIHSNHLSKTIKVVVF